MITRILGLALFLVALVAFTAAQSAAADPVVALGIAGRTNANASIAASGSFVAVTWGAATPAGTTDIYVSTSVDGGATFRAPVRVSDARSRASLSGEQPPRLALAAGAGRAPGITIVWTTKAVEGTRLVSVRSTDGGRTFTAPAALAGAAAPGNRGWEAIAATPDGKVAAIWLDHRDTVGAVTTGDHGTPAMHQHATTAGPQADPTVRAQLSKLWFSRLDDPANTKPVASGVCYCCKTAIATGSTGAIYTAWRHVYAGSHRDIAFAMSQDAGRTFTEPIRVSQDDWQLDGCPENGPALAVDGQGRIHLVWPTLIKDSGRETLAIFYSTSRDGRTFTPRQRIPTTSVAAYHPQLAIEPDGRLIVAWDEVANGVRRVRLARGAPRPDGTITFIPIPLPDSEGSYPAIAVTSAGPVAVWSGRAASGAALALWRADAAAAASPQALFDRGQTIEAFLAGASSQRERWMDNAKRSSPPDALVRRLTRANQGLRFLIVAEDWCVDSVNTVPYVAALAEQARVPVRIVDRVTGRAVMERHRTEDGRTVTPLIVLLRDGVDVDAWVERPAPLQKLFGSMATSPSDATAFGARQQWYDADNGRTALTEIVDRAEASQHRR